MRKIYATLALLPAAMQLMAQQPPTMIVNSTNGASSRTNVEEIDRITFSEASFNLNESGLRIIEANELTWPDDRLLPCFLPPAATVKTLDMNSASLSGEERVMFSTLQGIINRSQPRILLYNHNEEPKATWPNAHNLKTSAVRSTAPYQMVKLFKDEIEGLVLYSNALSEHYSNLAATVAGLGRLLPVTPEIRAKLIANGMDFPVVEDFTELTMTKALDIYTYLYDNYWSRCNHRLLVSIRPAIPYVHDIAAACGSACVWLDPRVSAESALLDKMLQDLTPGRDIVLGWYPEERSGVGAATKFGLSTVPADFFENTTVYSAVNVPVCIPPVPKRPKLENKVYAAVYISDGDNIQYCQHAMAKIFEQSARGKMAFNWTVSPSLADISPSMLNYYYGKATANDCFVSGPSGLGYAMPYDAHNKKYYGRQSTTKIIAPYTGLTQRYLEKTGLRVVTIWDDISAMQRKVYADSCTYLYGLSINDWERQVGRLSGSVQSGWLPIIPQYPCYANGPDVFTNFFNRDITNFTGDEPMFVMGQASVWEAGPDKLLELNTRLDQLSPGNVNIVRADHWYSYYNEAHHLPFNLTLMDEMTVSSSASQTDAAMAANGSPSEKYMWVSDSSDSPAWVLLDFKEPYQISRYVVRHAEAGGLAPQLNNRDLQIEVSLDGNSWTTVGAHSGNTAAVSESTFTPVEARYVRINVAKGGDDGLARIGDIEIYGSH